VIVDTPGLGWRWCFYLCVPIAVIAFVLLLRTLRLPTSRRHPGGHDRGRKASDRTG
jgi:predicted MFS family arabinose efflux permease